MNFAIEPIMVQCVQIARENQTPFGAALVNLQGEVLELAANTGATDGPTAHAEVNVLRNAHRHHDQNLVLVTTCEPCPMCAGAAVWAGVSAIYYGTSIPEAKTYLKQIDIRCQEIVEASWKKIPVEGGVLRQECLGLFR